MRWTAAAKLHNEDEVIIKETGEAMDVVEVEVNKSAHRVEVMLTDGNWYHHKEIK